MPGPPMSRLTSWPMRPLKPFSPAPNSQSRRATSRNCGAMAVFVDRAGLFLKIRPETTERASSVPFSGSNADSFPGLACGWRPWYSDCVFSKHDMKRYPVLLLASALVGFLLPLGHAQQNVNPIDYTKQADVNKKTLTLGDV